ncbi:zinc finger, CCHC-type containing protein [Tanacetum coccineum]
MGTIWCLCIRSGGVKTDALSRLASNWLERLAAGSISTWEDLTTCFLAQFFPPRRTIKLQNDILLFQQHQGESLSEAWTRFKDLLQKVPHHGIDFWLQIQIFYEHVSFHLKCEIDRAAGGKIRNKIADESWEIIKNLALYDHESWNDSRDFVKPVKAISTSQRTLEEVDGKGEVENRINNEPARNTKEDLTGEKIRELVETPRSEPIKFYLKHKINKELIEGLVGNSRFNDSLLVMQSRKMECEAYHSLLVESMRKAMLKKMITKKEDMGETT